MTWRPPSGFFARVRIGGQLILPSLKVKVHNIAQRELLTSGGLTRRILPVLLGLHEARHHDVTQRNGNGRIARKAALLATALGLWGALVLLFAAPLALTRRLSWQEAVGFGGFFWALWLLLLPVVAWLAFRFPIERKRFLRNLGLHAVVCVVFVVTNVIVFRAAAMGFTRSQRYAVPGPPGEGGLEGARLRRQDGSHPRPSLPPRGFLDLVGPGNTHGVFLGLRAALDVLFYWAVVGVCQAITNYRNSQERERRAVELEASLTSARLQALRMQMNPHFLFNTLNSIAALVYVNPRAADEMLGDLSELLRRSLDTMKEHEVSLGQELEFIRGYISIEQKRFGERLRVEQDVPAELRNAMVPAFILQPLVENAIRHGIEPRRGPGLICIEARQENDQLHLVVRDDGRGLPDGEPDIPARRGIGLANTQARLQALYGPNQRFSLTRAEPQGCRVDVHLPFRSGPMPAPTASKDPAA